MPPHLLIPFTYTRPEYFGGIERKILTIAAWFQARELLQPVLVLSHPDSQFGRAFADLGLPVEPFIGNGAPNFAQRVSRLRSLVNQYRPVAVESHQFRDLLCAAAVRRQSSGLRHLCRIHTHIDGSAIPAWRRNAYHLLDAVAQTGVDQYCVLSRALADECVRRSRISRRKIMVVPNGIPPLGPPPPPGTGAEPLHPVVAVVGEFEPRKRQVLLVRALGELKRRHGLQISARFIGGDAYGYAREVLAAAAEEDVRGQIEILGERSDVYELVRDIDVHVLTSDFEGIPTSMIEAMSIKKLAIASNVGGTADLIVDGGNGRLFPAGDRRRLVEILAETFTRPAGEFAPMREAGYRTWATSFTVEKMMAGLCEGFRRCGIDLPVKGVN